jgi:hypothetical protein
MWIIKPEQPEWKRTLKNINPNAVVALAMVAIGMYLVSAVLIGLI